MKKTKEEQDTGSIEELTNKVEKLEIIDEPVINFSKRIKYIVLHYTVGDEKSTLKWFNNEKSFVSSHYLINKSGTIKRLVQESDKSFHAGVSQWGAAKLLNESSIGIEIENTGAEAFESEQIESCIKLCKEIMKTYDIPATSVIGHSDIATLRKSDPGMFFPWEKLAKHGIGKWYKEIKLQNEDKIIFASKEFIEDYIDTRKGLFNENVELSPRQKVIQSIAQKGYKFSEVTNDRAAIEALRKNLSKIGYNTDPEIKDGRDITGRKCKVAYPDELDNNLLSVFKAFQLHFYPKVLEDMGGVAAYLAKEDVIGKDQEGNDIHAYGNGEFIWTENCEIVLAGLLQ